MNWPQIYWKALLKSILYFTAAELRYRQTQFWFSIIWQHNSSTIMATLTTKSLVPLDSKPPDLSAATREIGSLSAQIRTTKPFDSWALPSQKCLVHAHGESVIGFRRVTCLKLEFSSLWHLLNAMSEEFAQNWIGSYKDVSFTPIFPASKFINSHVIYEINKYSQDAFHFSM